MFFRADRDGSQVTDTCIPWNAATIFDLHLCLFSSNTVSRPYVYCILESCSAHLVMMCHGLGLNRVKSIRPNHNKGVAVLYVTLIPWRDFLNYDLFMTLTFPVK